MCLREVVPAQAMRANRVLAYVFCLFFLLCFPLAAQQRPLRTADAEILPVGAVRLELGFDFLQDVTYPLSGLSGDQTSVGVLGIRVGLARIVEAQVEGTAHHFLDVRQQVPAFVTPQLTGPGSTQDWGDFSIFTKVRLFGEGERRPALAVRFGFQMPTSNQARGIGTNTSNIFSGLVFQKHIRKLNLFGNVGVGFLEAPARTFAQNDVLTYAVAFRYAVHGRAHLLGEVAGRHSTRSLTPELVGTESRSQGRFGIQFSAAGFHWDVAAIVGLTRHEPNTGFTFGISREIRLWHSWR